MRESLVPCPKRRGEAMDPHTNDGDIVLGSLELPEGNVDGDATLTLGLELVKNPRILEGTLAEFGGFLLRGRWLASRNTAAVMMTRTSAVRLL